MMEEIHMVRILDLFFINTELEKLTPIARIISKKVKKIKFIMKRV